MMMSAISGRISLHRSNGHAAPREYAMPHVQPLYIGQHKYLHKSAIYFAFTGLQSIASERILLARPRNNAGRNGP